MIDEQKLGVQKYSTISAILKVPKTFIVIDALRTALQTALQTTLQTTLQTALQTRNFNFFERLGALFAVK